MNRIEILSDRKWKYLSPSKRTYNLLQVPKTICTTSDVSDGTKRKLMFVFDSGVKLSGAASITSGREISIPKHLHHYFEEAKWFECEIVDKNLYEKVTLDIV